jgi:hypothetical protein
MSSLLLCGTAYAIQLNLRNDALRRKFDTLKYDIKKIEEGQRLNLSIFHGLTFSALFFSRL